jgi:hypothetical protein
MLYSGQTRMALLCKSKALSKVYFLREKKHLALKRQKVR